MIYTDDTPLQQNVFQTTLSELEASLAKYMPSGLHHDYFVWAISQQNPYRLEFLEATGINQFVNQTLRLIEGLFSPAEWQQMICHIAEINTFSVYDLLIQNLARGLAGQSNRENGQRSRAELLSGYHDLLLTALNDASLPAAELLQPLRTGARNIKLFDQSMPQTNECELATAYLRQRPDTSLNDIKFPIWPFLVANVEYARAVLAKIEPPGLQALARASLQQHYQAMNIFLQARSQNYHQMIWVGSRSVMVVPVLAYYIAFIGKNFEDQDGYQQVIADGTLEKNLYYAALLARLLGDFGSELLSQKHDELKTIFLGLKYWNNRHTPRATLAELLDLAGSEFHQLAHLRADAISGAYNVALYGIDLSQPALTVLDLLEERIAYYTDLYNTTYLDFSVGIHHLNSRLRDSRVTRLITRFVKFHEQRNNGNRELTT